VIQAPGSQFEGSWKELFVMKRHARASIVSIGTQNDGGAAGRVPHTTPAASNGNARAQAASRQPSLGLVSENDRTHTLILTGELNHRSAHALEAEIERVCEEGVTGITLDLRELKYIDSIGVAVIAFRCGLCKRRGYDFAVIPGSRLIHRAFEQAGVTDLLPFQEEDVASRRPTSVLGHRLRDNCEQ
jgi:anti-anti-sigma factor